MLIDCRRLYLVICFQVAVFTLLAIFVDPYFLSSFQEGSVGRQILQNAVLVIACYASLEVFRGARGKVQKIIAGLMMAPLVLLVAFSLYWAIQTGINHIF